MLCEICGENHASFIISMVVNSEIKEIRACAECATRDMRTSDLIDGTSYAYRSSGETDRECPRCNFKYSRTEHSQLLLLGCPACYTEFREELKPLLHRIHGSTIHKGKAPKKRERADVEVPSRRSKFVPTSYLRVLPMSHPEAEWMQGVGPDSDVVISSRIRLARNLDGYTFCNLAKESELQQIARTVESAAADIEFLKNARVTDLENLDDVAREFLVERHLISRDLAEKRGTRKVIIGEREIISIMLNEEDHVRLQIINSGLQISQLWEIIDNIDNELGQRLDYAFSSDWGYLTACPTNVGTGLRVSVMLHIPALASTRAGNKILSSVSGMGYTIRGIYGEGSQATGAFYQISNEATLGQPEEKIVDLMRSVARQIIEYEREERQRIIEKDRIGLEDKIFRSYGTLTNARSISSREALNLLSWISLGINIGILSGLDETDIARLLVLTRPAHLQRLEGKKLNATARDISRATVIRSVLVGNRSSRLNV